MRSLNVFHPNASLEEKTDCKSSIVAVPMKPCRDFLFTLVSFFISVTFRLYDMDCTGFIERQEVYISKMFRFGIPYMFQSLSF